MFGNELHRYSIADGIRDKNVLGFDPYMVPTYKERDLRKAVALEKAKAPTEAAAMSDPKKKKAYLHYMDHTSVPMAGVVQADGTYLKGIEDYLPNSQYEREEHQRAVVTDILDNWLRSATEVSSMRFLQPAVSRRRSNITGCSRK